MKKIYYIVSLAILALFTACQDYNEKNFPGFDQAAIPTNLVAYTYSLTSADYSTIASTIKKPVTDSVTLMNTQLKNAKNAADSAIIKAVIKRLNTKLTTDSTLVAATAIGANRIFINQKQYSSCIPIILNAKYLYADPKSTALVSFNLSPDTSKIVLANKYTLVAKDYTDMGAVSDLSATKDPNIYIPILLKQKFPYALKGDVKLVRYLYYASSVVSSLASEFIFDGTNWLNFTNSNLSSAKFSFKNNAWAFINSEVFVEKFLKDFGQFTPVVVTGTYTWTWSSFNGGCFVGNAYQKGVTEIWMVSPVIDLKERINPTLSFDYAINYGGSLVIPDLFGVYVSTDYTTDVTKATWTKLDLKYPTTFSWTFINSGKLSLVNYVNKKITIGYKYASAGTAIAVEVSNVNLLDE